MGFCVLGSLGNIVQPVTISKSINGVLKALQSPAEEDSLALLHTTCVKLLGPRNGFSGVITVNEKWPRCPLSQFPPPVPLHRDTHMHRPGSCLPCSDPCHPPQHTPHHTTPHMCANGYQEHSPQFHTQACLNAPQPHVAPKRVAAEAGRELVTMGSQQPERILAIQLYLLLSHTGPGRRSLKACEGQGLPPARRGKVRKRSRFWATCFHRCLKVLEPKSRASVSRRLTRKRLKDLGRSAGSVEGILVVPGCN